MADSAGMADIRGLNIQKEAIYYENEALILKNLIRVENTPNRQIRYYQKTSGFLTVSAPGSLKVAEGARPFVLKSSWTRNTAYTKKYFVESELITMEDETDNDVQVFRNNLQDLTEAISYDVDSDIWDVISESQSPTNINSVTSNADWDAASGQDPIEDIEEAKQKIREQTKKQIKNGVLLLNAKSAKDLFVWLISAKGANIPQFSSEQLKSKTLMNIGGLNVIVSENVTADYAMVGDLSQAAAFKQFKPLTTYIVNDEGIGRKIRVSEHGICILEKPKFLSLISGIDSTA